jgi:hypothetical protein
LAELLAVRAIAGIGLGIGSLYLYLRQELFVRQFDL